MMTFMEVKGQQRSNIENNALWLNLVKPLMEVKNDDDLCGGQRSTEVKYRKQCSVTTKLGQKNR